MRRCIEKKKLGRYPFRAMIDPYIEDRSTYMADGTVTEDRRKLRYFDRIFSELKEAGKIDTADPRHMTRKEIEAFLRYTKNKGISETTRKKYVAILKGFLQWAGNDVIEEMKQDRRIKMPRETENHSIRALSIEEISEILKAADSIEGWRGTVLRGFIALGFSTGCRPKELLNAETADVDLDGMRFYVRHPKGESAWGKTEWIPIIRGDMVPWLEELISARRAIESDGLVSQYLFCNKSSGKPYSGNGIRRLKSVTIARTGIDWQLKDLRSSLTSVTLAGNTGNLKAVSLQLRHSSVSMTEKYYAKISRDSEIRNSIGETWKRNPIRRNRFQ